VPTASRTIPLIVAAAFFMETLDATIVTTALPAIAQDMGETTLAMAASISVYLVAMAAFVPTAGWAAERYGARNLFAAAVGVFALASLLCGIAPTFWTLIAARLLQGTAAAFMSPVGRLVVLAGTPKHRLINAIAWTVWPALIAPIVGPPLGGFITTYASWRWIFLVNIPLGVVGVWLVLRFVPQHVSGARRPFDLTGFVLTAAALAALIHGLSLAGTRGPEVRDGVVLIAIGAACGIAAVRHALRHPTPLLDLAAVKVPTFALSTLTTGMLARIAISMTPFLLPLMFQIGFGLTPFAAGLMLLVYMGGNLAMKSITTGMLRRFGFRNVLLGNGVLCAAAIAACGLLTPDVPLMLVYPLLFFAGMTRSMHFTTVATLAFADVTPEQRPGATTLSAMASQIAVALGVAMAAFALSLSQSFWHATDGLVLADFRHALFGAGALMLAAVALSLRLPRDAGAEVSQRA
jgi:EmrB/QacA subfamily drug resistance transporter